jgi:Amt family ammonium transporter
VFSAAPVFADDAAARLAALETATADLRLGLDIVWILAAAALVLVMQCGFLLLESGLARSKHSINVALKNVVDFMVAAVVFYLVGYGLMFGASVAGLVGAPAGPGPAGSDPRGIAFFVFQTMFVGAAATIVSGAIAERMTFAGYLVLTATISLLVYPIFGHWAWGGALDPANAGWLASLGFIDFAGSTVVHAIGGWLGLAGVVLLGPRLGRFDAEGRVAPMHGHSTTLAAAGAMLLFVGWIGFNGGSTLQASAAAPGIVLNTILGGVSGGAAAMLAGRALDRAWVAGRALNGLLGGLVGVTAGCAVIGPEGAIATGVICGVAVSLAETAVLHRLKLDDVVGAVSVHGVGGLLGTLLVAAFAREDALIAGSRLEQLGVQALGSGAAFLWAFGCGVVLFGALSMLGLARVSAEDEIEGLNAAEHGATLGTGMLQAQLHAMVSQDRDLTRRLDRHSGDETAEIAAILNPFIAEMQAMLRDVAAQAARVSTTATELASASRSTLAQSETLAGGTAEMSDASDRLASRLDRFGTTSRAMASTSQDVVLATRGMSASIDRVTRLLDDLIGSVRDVAGSAGEGTAVSANAKTLVGAANEAMRSLNAATREIEDVTALIEGFAEKTNLLALNATIEAARAGEAGRGFAVVAGEVKQLAQDTTRATDEIRRKVTQVRRSGALTGDTVAEVRTVFETLDRTMAAIADAAAEQGKVMGEVASQTRGAFASARGVVAATGSIHANVDEMIAIAEEMAAEAARVDRVSGKTHGLAAGGVSGARDLADAAGGLEDVSSALLAAAGRYRT